MKRRAFVGFTLAQCGVSARVNAQTRATDIVSAQEQEVILMRELQRAVGSVKLQFEKVRIEVPALADNGNSVACSVIVDSPMTAQDHVQELWMFAAVNPRPMVLKVNFSLTNPVARLDIRLRLAASQRLLAIAKMADGQWLAGTADVVVNVSACVDGS
jgi:sulfur-oxidizing protein SoxY